MARYESKDTWFEHNGENGKKTVEFVYAVTTIEDPRDTLIRGLRVLYQEVYGGLMTVEVARTYHRRIGRLLRTYDNNASVRWAR